MAYTEADGSTDYECGFYHNDLFKGMKYNWTASYYRWWEHIRTENLLGFNPVHMSDESPILSVCYFTVVTPNITQSFRVISSQ